MTDVITQHLGLNIYGFILFYYGLHYQENKTNNFSDYSTLQCNESKQSSRIAFENNFSDEHIFENDNFFPTKTASHPTPLMNQMLIP